MRMSRLTAAVVVPCLGVVTPALAEPAITVYNQNFAVIRDSVPLDLKSGVNEVTVTEVTNLLEPDSVILRDPAGKRRLTILEQNYRNDPVSQGLLLSLYEGKTLDFEVKGAAGQPDKIVKTKVIRSGYVPALPPRRYSPEYYYYQQQQNQPGLNQPVVEIDGRLQFHLPGTPLFPELADRTILKPTLHWLIQTDQPGPLSAEFAYVTGGMTWEADYNVVAPEEGETMDLAGWVTIENNTGKTFENARIKLMAGDVSKVQPPQVVAMRGAGIAGDESRIGWSAVTEKAFEEYHLYTLHRPTSLLDRQTKQVEFVRAAGVRSQRLYVYDGAKIDWNRWRGYGHAQIRETPEYGTECNPKVWTMREFQNSRENNLGMPLPKGRVRFYRQDADRQLEFIGENTIDHTPKDERVRVYIGNAFDITGERKRMDYQVHRPQNTARESFEITLHNHKPHDVEVRVVEHLYRWTNWEVTQRSDPFDKKDSQTIEFRVKVPAEEMKTIKYTVLYSW